MFFSGLTKPDWDETSALLRELQSDPSNVVHVDTDAEGIVTFIYIQLAEQRKLFERFHETVQLDATHQTNKVGMPLYTLLVQDNFGLGQPVCYFFVKEETKERILAGLRIFGCVST